ncbi:MAG: SAM-dependent methyltransferase, partial [Mesorhizobium sp.]
MSELFDGYRSSYGEVVEGSIRFSRLKHDFFLIAKADLLRRLVVERRLRQG